MSRYSPTTPRERTALGVVAFVISLSLMCSVLTLFNDGYLPWVDAAVSVRLAKTQSPPASSPAVAQGKPTTLAANP